MEGADVYVDPWQEYKAISGRLKKRFLRKPNLAEASRSFERLARRLEKQEADYHYAGFCRLGVARCEHSAGNLAGETGGLVAAGQLFVKAEREKADLSLPSYEDNLNIAIHCYGHAIRVHLEHNETELAASLCLELGLACASFMKFSEGTTHFSKAAEYLQNFPQCRIYAMQWLTLCNVKCGRFQHALANVEAMDKIVQAVMDDKPPVGFYRDLSRDLDILYLFCALYLRYVDSCGTCTAHVKDDRWRTAVELFTKVSIIPSRRVIRTESDVRSSDPIPGQPSTSSVQPVQPASKDLASQSRLHPYMSEDLFLYVQSFALAILENNWNDADEMLTQAWPYLTALHQEIAMELVLRAMEQTGG